MSSGGKNMSQEQVVEKENEITTLNVYRKDLPLISTVKDLLGFENSQDLLHVILAKAIEEVERQERIRAEVFPLPTFPVSSNFVMGFKCFRCADAGIGDFVYRTKGELLDHQAVDEDLIASGRYGALTLLHIDERRKIHESLRQKKAEEHQKKYEAFKQALVR
jgi:hypothetical protein